MQSWTSLQCNPGSDVDEIARQRAKRCRFSLHHAGRLRVESNVDVASHCQDPAVGNGCGGYDGQIDALETGTRFPGIAARQRKQLFYKMDRAFDRGADLTQRGFQPLRDHHVVFHQ
jgi:hypothetical protein